MTVNVQNQNTVNCKSQSTVLVHEKVDSTIKHDVKRAGAPLLSHSSKNLRLVALVVKCVHEYVIEMSFECALCVVCALRVRLRGVFAPQLGVPFGRVCRGQRESASPL